VWGHDQPQVVDSGRSWRRGCLLRSGAGVDMSSDPVGDALAHRPPMEPNMDLGQVEGVEDNLDSAPDQGGVDLIGVAVQGTVAVLVTVRRSDRRNASCNAAGGGNTGGPGARNRASGACPVSE